jgi:hypothetical protein
LILDVAAVGSYEPAGGPRAPNLEGGELRRLRPNRSNASHCYALNGLGAVLLKYCRPRGALRPEASSIRGRRVVLPIGINSRGYDHRRNELVSTVTARASEVLWKRCR